MLSRLMVLLLIVGLLVAAAPILAQSVTYCDEFLGPFGDFNLTIPRYDVDDYSLLDAEVLLTVSYAGTFVGENVDPDLTCSFGFSMDSALETSSLTDEAMVATSFVELSGDIPVGEGVNLPFDGVFWNGATVEWTNLLDFHADQDLVFMVPSSMMGFVVQMFGEGVFSWTLNLNAQVCVTYTFDIAVPVESITFDSIKATYR